MNNQDFLTKIKSVSLTVTNNDIDALRMEEELLTSYIRSGNCPDRQPVLDRIEVINKAQLVIFRRGYHD